MCTVTYVPTKHGYLLTSNRDEKHTRSKALPPREYKVNGETLIFPKDTDAHGTWIVLKQNGDSLCLLNGAFETYSHTNAYTISRGKIVLNIAATNNMIETFSNIELKEVAPFTLVVVNNNLLYECRWDGNVKYSTQINNNTPHIWSSATLYNAHQQTIRQGWFANWLSSNVEPSFYNIFSFHKNAGDGDVENNLMVNRNDKLYTVSITGIAIDNNECIMNYLDVTTNEHTEATFNLEAISA